jgi:hypothetical protein
MRNWTCVTLALVLTSVPLGAEVIRVEAEAPVPMAAKPGRAAYETISGVFHGELDPKAPANRIITDIAKAPRNARGMVEYSASFRIARAVDPAQRSGVLSYQVVNRGGGVSLEPDEDGHTQAISGWQGDLALPANVQWIKVPVAAGIEGPTLVRLTGAKADAGSLSLNGGLEGMARRAHPAKLDTSRARLTVERKGEADRIVPATDWAFADCRTAPFPGTPDPAQLCLKDKFDPDAAYTLTYTAKDPLVLGVGFAATRDLVAYLRSGKGEALGGTVRWAVGIGNSQSGNFLRSFTHLGFNTDEAGGRVFDGINPNIAARQIVLNQRFGAPAGAGGRYAPGSEGVLWWGVHDDRARKQGKGSLLARCTASKTCPKVVETFGSAEIWGLRASPGMVGIDGKRDIPLPANVRRYYFPSVTHGGSFRGGFATVGDPAFMGATCLLPGNPNPIREQMRVARKALVNWIAEGREPPQSSAPTLANDDLVEPSARAMGWPAIPGAPLPDGHINPLFDYDFGPGFITRDTSGAASRQPPRLRRILPQRVPRVDADGNETAGLRSVQLQVPLGTYTGWNVETKGYHAGENCGFAGGFIPFARTKSEREAKGDPRLSLEERYGSYAGFVARVREAVARTQATGWLLPDDAARLIAEAEASEVLK